MSDINGTHIHTFENSKLDGSYVEDLYCIFNGIKELKENLKVDTSLTEFLLSEGRLYQRYLNMMNICHLRILATWKNR